MSEESTQGTLLWRGGYCWAMVGKRTSFLGECSTEARAIELADELCLIYQDGSPEMEKLIPRSWRPGQRQR